MPPPGRTVSERPARLARGPAPPSGGPDVVEAGVAQSLAVGGVLARAFHRDPLMVHGFPDPERRARVLPQAFRVLARFADRHGFVLGTSPRLEAASVWVAPGGFPASTPELLRLGMAAWPFTFRPASFIRVFRAMEAMDHVHARHVKEPHWYLWALGAEPALQGRGLGTALLRDGLARVDRDGLPCYLETFQPRNLPLYRRHGFEVVEELDPPGGAPRMWGMLRPATRDA